MKNPDHTYVKLGKDNIAGFKDLLPHYFGDEPEKDVIVIGVMVGDTPCAAMMLRKDNGRKIMKVEHIFVLPEYRRLGIGKKLILAARDTAETGGFHGLEMRYYWGDPEVPAGFLISTGLKYNRIAAVTNELSRPVLQYTVLREIRQRHVETIIGGI